MWNSEIAVEDDANSIYKNNTDNVTESKTTSEANKSSNSGDWWSWGTSFVADIQKQVCMHACICIYIYVCMNL